MKIFHKENKAGRTRVLQIAQPFIGRAARQTMNMSFPFMKQDIRWRIPAAILLLLVGLFLAGTSFAKVILNTIDPVAVVSDNGRSIVLTGPLECDQTRPPTYR